MKRTSFANRLSWKVIGVSSAVMVAMLLVVAWTSHSVIADEAMRSTRYMLHGTISEIERPLNEVEVAVQTVAAHVEVSNGEALQSLTRHMVELDSLVSGCYIVVPSDKGKDICYTYTDAEGGLRTGRLPMTKDNVLVGDRLMALVREGKPCWSDPYAPIGNHTLRVATYCYPIVHGGTVETIVAADLPIDWIEHKLQSLKPYPNSITTILCPDGALLGVDNPQLETQIRETVATNTDLAAATENMKQGKDSLQRLYLGRKLAFIVYAPLHNGWTASVSCRYGEVLARSSAMHTLLFFIGLVGLVLLYFLCRHTIRRATLPITQLSASALEMARGDFNAQMPEIKTQDEMRQLRDSFVYMQNSIADYIVELKATTSANERMESELNVARNIQMGMLRHDFPPQLHALLAPAKAVGGDLYDFVVRDGMLYFAVGDVSGKGVPASLLMAITRAALRFVSGLDITMDNLVGRINNSVADSNADNMFVTLFVGRIRLADGHMDYCNAGHNPILLLPPGGAPVFLHTKPNLAVGLIEGFPYEAESLDLKPGTRIVAYTDGVNEAEDASGHYFGNDRLLAWAASLAGRELTDQQVVDDLYREVRTFTAGNEQNDDITIMSLSI